MDDGGPRWRWRWRAARLHQLEQYLAATTPLLLRIIEGWVHQAGVARNRWAIHRLAQEVLAGVFVKAILRIMDMAAVESRMAWLLDMAAEVMDEMKTARPQAGAEPGRLPLFAGTRATALEMDDATLEATFERLVSLILARAAKNEVEIAAARRALADLFVLFTEGDRLILQLAIEHVERGDLVIGDDDAHFRGGMPGDPKPSDEELVQEERFFQFLERVAGRGQPRGDAVTEGAEVCEDRQRFDELLARIEDRLDRDILRLSVQQNLSSDRIQLRLGLLEGDVWRRLFGALDQLYALWKEQ